MANLLERLGLNSAVGFHGLEEYYDLDGDGVFSPDDQLAFWRDLLDGHDFTANDFASLFGFGSDDGGDSDDTPFGEMR